MSHIKKVTALVPMKGHSERVKNKNIRDFNGKPLFWHILYTLTQCESVSEVYVDTDSDFLAQTVLHYFPEVTIINRPEQLCGDYVSMNEIIRYDIDHIGGEYFLQTHSTNPLLKQETIDDACKRFFGGLGESDSLFTVNRLQTRLYDENGIPINHDPNTLIRTQDLNPIYEENSNLYIFSQNSFRAAGARIGRNPILYEMDSLESCDIDEENDFLLAELIQRLRKDGIEQ